MTDYDLHIQAMESPEYAIHHNRSFHGPGFLNINAMQMCANDQIDDKQFFPTRLYDVYVKNELFGTPLYRMLTSHHICDKLGFSRGVWLKITQANFDVKTGEGSDYEYIESGRTAAEWNINGKIFYDAKETAEYLKISTSSLPSFVKTGRLKKRHVILDLDGEVVEEIR
jgi:hypothetical protein